ncbi:MULTISPECIES: PAS domain-containing protein [Thalassobaculum]|uniref:PAS domain-containing protein n=1 Tax=Thalassobaculum litoreum DSM 18839 TaxID=1123362 RepID=A0A8G2BNF7_9PROT|nr:MULTISPECIES: PAS domain-containing protein [Thalassobaculum]SDG42655.1 PAS domain-containing protein [Thalassobaculum litoreum DSM 18839]
MAVGPLHSTLRRHPSAESIAENSGHLVVGEPTLVSPIVARGHAAWAAACCEGALPLADDLKAEALAGILPYVYLVDVLSTEGPGPMEVADFRYRLVGTDVVSHTAADNTGRRLSDIAGQGSQATLIRLYTLASNAAVPAVQRIAYLTKSGSRHWYETIVMPMTTKRGGPADRLLGVAEHFCQRR